MMHSFRTLTDRAVVGMTALLCLLNCLPAGAGQKKENGLYTLHYKFKAGDVSDYQTSGQLSIGGASGGKSASKPTGQSAPMVLPLNASQKVKVLKALPDGSGQLEMTVLSAGMAPGGSAATPNTATYTLSPTGVISGVKGNLGGGGSDMISRFSSSIVAGSVTASLPEKAVKPGDTWTRKVAVSQSGITGAVVGTFVSIGQTGRYKTAHLKLLITVPINTVQKSGSGNKTPDGKGTPPSMNLTGKLVMTFEDDFALTEGKLIKSTGSGTVNITMQPNSTGDKPGTHTPSPKPISLTITLSSSLTQ